MNIFWGHLNTFGDFGALKIRRVLAKENWKPHNKFGGPIGQWPWTKLWTCMNILGYYNNAFSISTFCSVLHRMAKVSEKIYFLWEILIVINLSLCSCCFSSDPAEDPRNFCSVPETRNDSLKRERLTWGLVYRLCNIFPLIHEMKKGVKASVSFPPLIPLSPLPERRCCLPVAETHRSPPSPERNAANYVKVSECVCSSLRVCLSEHFLEVTHHFLARLDVVRALGGAGRSGSSPPVK